jgi:hypothetical protein
MLAPFVLNLLIGCSLLLLAGWTGDTISTWTDAARRADDRDSQGNVETRRRIDHAALSGCTSCGASGDWLWKIDPREVN